MERLKPIIAFPDKLRLLMLYIVLAVTVPAMSSDYIYKYQHYDDMNGMTQWHVTKMLQDKQGFMWFSTWNGLNRFDGYDFVVFKSRPGDGNEITSDRIRNILLGEDGNIYCANGDDVWRFNLSTYRFEPVDSVLAERFRARLDSDAAMYRDSRDYQFGDYTFSGVRMYMQDLQKNHWFMERFGVTCMSQQLVNSRYLECVPRSTVRGLFRDNKKRIWVGTRDANVVVVLDSMANFIGYLGRDGHLHKELTTFGPTYSFFQQKNGILWIGTKPDGLYRLRETADGVFSVEHFTKGTAAEIKAGKTLNSTDIYTFHEDKKGRLWIGTQGGGINLLVNPTAEAEQLRFLNRENTFASYPATNLFMRRLMSVGNGMMLATTTEGLLFINGIDGDPRKVTFTLHQRESHRSSSLSCSAVMDMLTDRKGRIFISTESGGVKMLLTKDLTSKEYEFAHFGTENGMGSDAALAMTEIGDEILVQCNNQITRINADMNAIENYNTTFFAINSRFSDAEPMLLRDGRWLLTLEDGVAIVSEKVFHQQPYVPRIVLTSFGKPNTPIDYSAELHDTLYLSSSERDVTIGYAAIDYACNKTIRYITRLTEQRHWWQKDTEEEWSDPTANHTLTLYNISPGTYTLEIRSTNADGMWVNNVRTLVIIVKPMFWETIWAYILYLLLIIGVLGAINYTYRHIKKLKRQREENLQAYLELLNRSQQQEMSAEEQHHVEPTPIVNEEDDAFMQRLMEFIEENMSDSGIGVDEMASATATSRSSLNRKMKQLLGVTPADFLKEARIKRACQLLATTMRGVNEIAYGCGFSDPKYFSKCFKAAVGMSPTEYRTKKQSGDLT